MLLCLHISAQFVELGLLLLRLRAQVVIVELGLAQPPLEQLDKELHIGSVHLVLLPRDGRRLLPLLVQRR